ncbi:MAG: PHP domain-containing protein, partial [Spirochaetales bacterium]|nr:PHP domain-containing protein [Spirochaetales bacterium]
MTSRPYAPLWCKTNFSFLEGASHPEEIIEACARLGITRVAITDRNGVYGIVRALVAAEEHKIRLIIGSELSLDDGINTVVVLVR